MPDQTEWEITAVCSRACGHDLHNCVFLVDLGIAKARRMMLFAGIECRYERGEKLSVK